MNPSICQNNEDLILIQDEINEDQTDTLHESEENLTNDDAEKDGFKEIPDDLLQRYLAENPSQYEEPSWLRVQFRKIGAWFASHELVLDLYIKYLDWKDWYYEEGEFAPKFQDLTKDQIQEIHEFDKEHKQDSDNKEL